MTSKRITISISQIAPLVGLDAYNNFPRIICELWRKNDPADFKLFETKLKEQGNQIATSNEMNDIWEADEALGTNILQQVKDINANKDKSSCDMVSQQEAIAKYINNNEKLANLDDKKKEELAKKVCSVTNKMHGVINEDSVLSEFCRLSEKTIKQTQGWIEIPCYEGTSEDSSEGTHGSLAKAMSRTEPSLRELPPSEPPSISSSSSTSTTSSSTKPNLKWVLVGKYDAITTDDELVEAKMRQKCLFKKVRDYENVQVQLYLHALKFHQAYLVESYTNKKNVNQTYVNEIKYDEEYVINNILERLQKFIKFFDVMMGSEEFKEGLLKGDKNRRIYNIYESEYLCLESLNF